MTKPTVRPVWPVFAVRRKRAQVLSYTLSAQRRLWSDWADLSLHWSHSHFVGFVTRWLILSTECFHVLTNPLIWNIAFGIRNLPFQTLAYRVDLFLLGVYVPTGRKARYTFWLILYGFCTDIVKRLSRIGASRDFKIYFCNLKIRVCTGAS